MRYARTNRRRKLEDPLQNLGKNIKFHNLPNGTAICRSYGVAVKRLRFDYETPWRLTTANKKNGFIQVFPPMHLWEKWIEFYSFCGYDDRGLAFERVARFIEMLVGRYLVFVSWSRCKDLRQTSSCIHFLYTDDNG